MDSAVKIIVSRENNRVCVWSYGQNLIIHQVTKAPSKRESLAIKQNQTLFGDQTCWCCTMWPCLNMFQRTKCFCTEILMSFKFYTTRLNTIKHGVQTGKGLIIKQGLIVFHYHSLPVWDFFFFAGRMRCNRMWTFEKFCSFRNRRKHQWKGISFVFPLVQSFVVNWIHLPPLRPSCTPRKMWWG